MCGDDVALRFTWSTIHIEVYIFRFRIGNLFLFLFPSLLPFLSSYLLVFFLSNFRFYCRFFYFFLSLFALFAADSAEFSLTITYNSNVLLPFTWIYTLDFSSTSNSSSSSSLFVFFLFYVFSSFFLFRSRFPVRVPFQVNLHCTIGTVWQARPTQNDFFSFF